MSQDSFSLEGFSGQARLFPLPNLVMFPHVVQPLHIFESRYVEMLEDALQDDNLVATALLQPGWEGEYEGRPAIDPIVCLGRVLSHSKAKDGKYNILLGGISRARICEELPVRKSFREAQVDLLCDVDPPDDDPAVTQRHAELVECFRKYIPSDMPSRKQLEDVLAKQSQLGTLTDLIGYSLPLELEFRQSLLAELDVMERTRLLIEHLSSEEGQGIVGRRQFPPEFSSN